MRREVTGVISSARIIETYVLQGKAGGRGAGAISKIVELRYTLAEFFEYSGSTLIGWGRGLRQSLTKRGLL